MGVTEKSEGEEQEPQSALVSSRRGEKGKPRADEVDLRRSLEWCQESDWKKKSEEAKEIKGKETSHAKDG
ncbi:hypothetical protein CNYM01_02461 [Colletotrichum nymphaeae SA-01]|uniref:Uncharacterized protein n=1 Tax=Colletotrichum nymphaeae SA-01 TaxID=1460502 RepID=A0A135S815_9PEZI|nr:hypothetical protein CNYM01_02461 [Colletotrichum nymphaeae SA-01]